MADLRWTVDADAAGTRVDRYLADHTRLASRSRAATALERGKVFLNGVELGASDAGRRLAAGDDLRVWMDRPGSASARSRVVRVGPIQIVYEDAALVVVNKPPGLLAVPLAGSHLASVADLLETRHRGRSRLLAVHRIDRDTSGLVVFAKTRAAQDALKDQFKARSPERVYLAVVEGCPVPPEGEWHDHLAWDPRELTQRATARRHPRAKEAMSRYRVVERLGAASLVEVSLVSGRRNQIRVQAALRGHWLVGERKYGRSDDQPPIRFERQALHAARLAFDHPVDGRRLRFEAPLPGDLAALLDGLRTAVRRAGHA